MLLVGRLDDGQERCADGHGGRPQANHRSARPRRISVVGALGLDGATKVSGNSNVYFNAPGVAKVSWEPTGGLVMVEWEGWADSAEADQAGHRTRPTRGIEEMGQAVEPQPEPVKWLCRLRCLLRRPTPTMGARWRDRRRGADEAL